MLLFHLTGLGKSSDPSRHEVGSLGSGSPSGTSVRAGEEVVSAFLGAVLVVRFVVVAFCSFRSTVTAWGIQLVLHSHPQTHNFS